ncbi:MAG: putative porin [Prevotella sp.]|nr:putative porin [Prevotella sp.]
MHWLLRSVLVVLFLQWSMVNGQWANCSAQDFDDANQQANSDRRNGNFNPHRNDTTGTKVVPKGIYVWTVDRHFGDIRRTDVDTLPHLYPQSTMGTGMYGQYNTLGSNNTARLSRIFTDRRDATQAFFTDTYDQVLRQPDQWHFTNTLSPITNLAYGSCGDKTNGEDLLDARFAVNAGKKTGLGFDLDYRYARGYFQNQNNSHFNASFYISHLGDRYQLHFLFQTYHQKAQENGGITNDDYITHPELFTESYSENEIPTYLSRNWNRNHDKRAFLTHRYNVGFYRKVPMTPEEIEAKKFALQAEEEKKKREQADKEDTKEVSAGRPDGAKIAGDEPLPVDTLAAANDSLTSSPSSLTPNDRISVTSKAQADSLIALEKKELTDSASLFIKREFVPVTSFIHTAELLSLQHVYQAYATPENYYAHTYFDRRFDGGYPGDSIYDKTKQFGLRNTLAVGLLEGFNKYVPAGLKVFAAHELRRIDMPDFITTDSLVLSRWTEHTVSIGGQLTKTLGTALHYDALAELWVEGEDAGQMKLDGRADLNFRLLGDTVRLDAIASIHRLHPVFLQRHYHSKHLWWDNDLEKETHTHLEGRLTYKKTNTSLRVALDEIENYTYLGMSYDTKEEKVTGLSAAFHQHSSSLAILTAQLNQRLRLGPLHWENIVTFQTSSDADVLPLPRLNAFTNLFLQFKVAGVLSVELGASATWFTKYSAPEFMAPLNQFAVTTLTSDGTAIPRRELGNFPFVDAYANLHLKHARFFIMMSNVTGTDFNRLSFLTPHYPFNRSVMHLGVSWNFFN